MITYYAAAQHQTPGSMLEAAVFALAVGLVFLMSGRHQRRTGRHILTPDTAVRVGDRLIEPAGTSKTRRVLGSVQIALSVIFIAAGLACLAVGLVSLVR